MNVFLIMNRRKSQRHRQLSLVRMTSSWRSLMDNIFSRKLPKTVPLLFDSYHKEVNRDDWASGHFEVFLHQAYDYLGLFCN